MSSGSLKQFCFFVSLLLAPLLTLADGRPWAVGLGVQGDAEGSSSVVASFDIAATQSTWLRASGSFGQSPNNRGDIQTSTASIGIDQSFGAVGLTLDLQQWGDPDLVESNDVKASLYFRNDDVSIALLGERRDIDLTFSVTGLGGQVFSRTTNFDADGWGLRLSAKPNERWRIYASGRKYDYSVNLGGLPRIQLVDFLFSSTLTLANSLVDFETSLGLERSFGERAVSVNYGRDRSAVDRTFLESVDLGVLLPVGKRVDVELSFGFSDSDDFGSEAFGGFYIYFYGG